MDLCFLLHEVKTKNRTRSSIAGEKTVILSSGWSRGNTRLRSRWIRHPSTTTGWRTESKATTEFFFLMGSRESSAIFDVELWRRSTSHYGLCSRVTSVRDRSAGLEDWYLDLFFIKLIGGCCVYRGRSFLTSSLPSAESWARPLPLVLASARCRCTRWSSSPAAAAYVPFLLFHFSDVCLCAATWIHCRSWVTWWSGMMTLIVVWVSLFQ